MALVAHVIKFPVCQLELGSNLLIKFCQSFLIQAIDDFNVFSIVVSIDVDHGPTAKKSLKK
jgi:hypothetical protein